MTEDFLSERSRVRITAGAPELPEKQRIFRELDEALGSACLSEAAPPSLQLRLQYSDHVPGEPETLRNSPRSSWPMSIARWLQDVFYQQLFEVSVGWAGYEDFQTALLLFLQEGGALTRINVGVTPRRDKMLAENQAALRAALSEPLKGARFECEVYNGIGGSDGWISADIAVPMVRVQAGAEIVQRKLAYAPLEIGSTRPRTTLERLVESRALARWPYGHSALTILTLAPYDAPLSEAQEAAVEALVRATFKGFKP